MPIVVLARYQERLHGHCTPYLEQICMVQSKSMLAYDVYDYLSLYVVLFVVFRWVAEWFWFFLALVGDKRVLLSIRA